MTEPNTTPIAVSASTARDATRYPDRFADIETKWQARWRDADIYRADDNAADMNKRC